MVVSVASSAFSVFAAEPTDDVKTALANEGYGESDGYTIVADDSNANKGTISKSVDVRYSFTNLDKTAPPRQTGTVSSTWKASFNYDAVSGTATVNDVSVSVDFDLLYRFAPRNYTDEDDGTVYELVWSDVDLDNLTITGTWQEVTNTDNDDNNNTDNNNTDNNDDQDITSVIEKDNPGTGDDFNAVPFVSAAVVALGSVAGVMVYKKKRDLTGNAE